jgi:hypothetical protein
MRHYETTAGYVTRGDTFAQLIEKLREAQELASVLGHLHALQDNDADKTLAHGWLGVSELLKRMQTQITTLAMRKMQ